MSETYTYFTTMPGCIIDALILANLVMSVAGYIQACRFSREETKYRRVLEETRQDIDRL